MELIEEIYESLERRYNVIHPLSEKSTYSSLLNYSDEDNKARQRWYRYKEGFSIDLVKGIIKEYNKNPKGIILDPFLGSGTTILAANDLGLDGVGFEVNPFSFFLAKCKLSDYSDSDIKEFKHAMANLFRDLLEYQNEALIVLPKLSIADKVFNPSIQNYFMSIKTSIESYKGSDKIRNLLMLGWLSSLEKISLYKKAGNGLKKKVNSNKNIISEEQVNSILLDVYNNIFNDISESKSNMKGRIYNDSSLNLKLYIEKESLSGVIFSPPYANSFDYTEIYKLELWFGGFVKEYSDLKKLRQLSLRSHLNGLTKDSADNISNKSIPELDLLLEELGKKVLWNKKIPLMLKLYFHEMFELLDSVYTSLEKDGFCSIVVGNSSYGGVIFPTDLLLSKYAESVGFKVDKILVDRYLITSSQQYHLTINSKKYLRESVICLVK